MNLQSFFIGKLGTCFRMQVSGIHLSTEAALQSCSQEKCDFSIVEIIQHGCSPFSKNTCWRATFVSYYFRNRIIILNFKFECRVKDMLKTLRCVTFFQDLFRINKKRQTKILDFFYLRQDLTHRSSHWRCSIKKGVLKNFLNFTGKHLFQSLFCSKKKLWHGYLLENFAKFLRFAENLRATLGNFCTQPKFTFSKSTMETLKISVQSKL